MFKADKKIYLKLAIISAHEEICTEAKSNNFYKN